MRDPGLAAVLSAIIPGVGQFYNGRILAGILWLIITPRFVDRHWRSTGMGVPRYRCLHRLQLRSRSLVRISQDRGYFLYRRGKVGVLRSSALGCGTS